MTKATRTASSVSITSNESEMLPDIEQRIPQASQSSSQSLALETLLVETDQLHDFLDGKTVEAADLQAQNMTLRNLVEAQNQTIKKLRLALCQRIDKTKQEELLNLDQSVTKTLQTVIEGLKLVDDTEVSRDQNEEDIETESMTSNPDSIDITRTNPAFKESQNPRQNSFNEAFMFTLGGDTAITDTSKKGRAGTRSEGETNTKCLAISTEMALLSSLELLEENSVEANCEKC